MTLNIHNMSFLEFFVNSVTLFFGAYHAENNGNKHILGDTIICWVGVSACTVPATSALYFRRCLLFVTAVSELNHC